WAPALLALAGCASSATSITRSDDPPFSAAAVSEPASATRSESALAPAVEPVSQLSKSRDNARSAIAIDQPSPPTAALAAEPDQFARELAAARGLPLDTVRAALAQAQYNATVARLMAPPPRADGAPRVRN